RVGLVCLIVALFCMPISTSLAQDTITFLMNFYGNDSKIIIWEHNTHIGDARATDMKYSNQVNVGQLLKEEHDNDVFRIGFGSYEGTMMAADKWQGKMKEMDLPKAKEGSWEYMLHNGGAYDKIILSKDIDYFHSTVGQRAIGVVYDPVFEQENYVPSNMLTRYEAFIFLDRTKALHPLHMGPQGMQMPETFPWGI
ncbi:MAG TPA: erythromycin esterase family protein, partial [Bacteroidia bacterium]|nr:erythromycin esterase family protein [Bacteroidia bacterium]